MTDLGLEHHIASMQPKKHLEDYSKDSKDGRLALEALEVLEYTKVQKLLEALDERLQRCLMPAGLNYEELGACQTRDDRTVHGYRMF